MDRVGALAHRSDQVAELDRRRAAGIPPGLDVQLGRGDDHLLADAGQLPGLLLGDEAVGDRRRARRAGPVRERARAPSGRPRCRPGRPREPGRPGCVPQPAINRIAPVSEGGGDSLEHPLIVRTSAAGHNFITRDRRGDAPSPHRSACPPCAGGTGSGAGEPHPPPRRGPREDRRLRDGLHDARAADHRGRPPGAADHAPPSRRLEGDRDRGARHAREPRLRPPQPPGERPPGSGRRAYRRPATTSSPTPSRRMPSGSGRRSECSTRPRSASSRTSAASSTARPRYRSYLFGLVLRGRRRVRGRIPERGDRAGRARSQVERRG